MRLTPLICGLGLFCSLQADDASYINLNMISDEPQKAEVPPIRNFEVKLRYDATGNATFTTPEVKNEHMRYAEGEAFIRYLYGLDCHTILSGGFGYNYTQVYWKDSPVLLDNTTNFNFAAASIGALSTYYDRWVLQAEVDYYYDCDRNNSNANLFLAAAWGRYALTDCWGISLGFVERSGIHQNKMWPIFGFDVQLPPDWSINLVYPVNISIAYHMTCHWSVAAVGRLIDSRHRLAPDDQVPDGILDYRNYGFELALNYDYTPIVSANIHAGYMTAGDLEISNRSNEHKTYYKSGGSPYVGAGVTVHF